MRILFFARNGRFSCPLSLYRKLSGLSSSDPVDDPCLPSGRSENVTATFDLGPTSAEAVEAKYGKGALGGETAIFLKGTGDWDKCYDSLKPFTRFDF